MALTFCECSENKEAKKTHWQMIMVWEWTKKMGSIWVQRMA